MRGASPDRQRGFTLIELMIVVVVLAIISALAVPAYRDSVVRGRRTDGRVALMQVAQRLERCYTQFGAYDAADCGIAVDDVFASADGHYEVTVAALDASTFTLSAAPQDGQAEDAECADLGFDNAGVRSATGTTPEKCW